MGVRFLPLAVLACVLSCVINALPAPSSKSTPDVFDTIEFVPLPNSNPSNSNQRNIETPDVLFMEPRPMSVLSPYVSGYNSDEAGGFLSAFDGFMNHVRRQFNTLLKSTAAVNSDSSDKDSTFGSGIIPFHKIDLSKGNSTSVTKVINGHPVVINETEYSESHGPMGGSYFKVSIIDFNPDRQAQPANGNLDETSQPEDKAPKQGEVSDNQSSEQQPKIPLVEKQAESMESHLEDNEIPKSRVLEQLDRSTESLEDNSAWIKQASLQLHQRPIKQFDGSRNDLDSIPNYNLAHDTYINELQDPADARHDPDVEVFAVLRK